MRLILLFLMSFSIQNKFWAGGETRFISPKLANMLPQLNVNLTLLHFRKFWRKLFAIFCPVWRSFKICKFQEAINGSWVLIWIFMSQWVRDLWPPWNEPKVHSSMNPPIQWYANSLTHQLNYTLQGRASRSSFTFKQLLIGSLAWSCHQDLTIKFLLSPVLT